MTVVSAKPRQFAIISKTNIPTHLNYLATMPTTKPLLSSGRVGSTFYLFYPIGMGFQHTTDYFKHRMQPIREWGEHNIKEAERFFDFLDDQLEGKDFIACGQLTVADINAFCSVDFGKVVNLRVDESRPNLFRWYQAMKQRASAKV